MENPDRKVDFGFEKVSPDEKAGRVRSVFASVAGKSDVMNDLMSFGVHRLWKSFTLSLTGLKTGGRALDVAGGTGDLAMGMLRQVGKSGRVVLSDVNPAMLAIGRDRLLDKGFVGNVECIVADAERLPFEENSFDCVTIGFGLRNVTDKAAALESMYRVLKPGGQLLVLEFSTPVAPGLKPIYDAYSFKVLPLLGRLVADDAASYRYLAESIRMHPDQETLLDKGFVGNVECVVADAERLPFDDDSFDCITIGFGLRNVTDKAAALESMYRVLKTGGQLLVLEFSTPVAPGLKPIYDAYSFKVLPLLGRLVANDEASYRYLAESIRMHPNQETLLEMLRAAGFAQARYHNLSGGIVAVHRGYKI